jgi:hypothetical protein
LDAVNVTIDAPHRRSRLRVVLGAIAVAVGAVVVLAPSAAPASALFGHVPIGGYDRGGYEYS